MRPGKLIEYIKENGFITVSQASDDLEVSIDEIMKTIEFLKNKRHLRKLDMSGESSCETGDCSGCKGCSTAHGIQEDGTPILYTLSPFM